MKIRIILWILLSGIILTRVWNLIGSSPLQQSSARYYVQENLGRDIQSYSVDAWYDVRSGKTPNIFGYGSVLVAGGFVQLFETTGMCSDKGTCGTLAYICLVAFGVLGLYLFTQKNALLFFVAFTLGIPMYRAMEAGNIDLFLFVLFGVVLVTVHHILQTKKHLIYEEVAVGILLGLMIHTKAFLLPFVILSLIAVPPSAALWSSFVLSFISFALWPWVFGVHTGIFDVFLFAKRDTAAFTNVLFTQINYGNNAIMPYVSNILQGFGIEKISAILLKILTVVFSVIMFLLIFIKPFFDENVISKIVQWKKIKRTFPFLLLCYVLSYIGIIALPAWSYDYRILYGIPIIALLYTLSNDQKTKRLLYCAIVSLLIKSLWIPKDRIMTVFLYVYLYFLLRAALSYWKSQSQPSGRKNSMPLV